MAYDVFLVDDHPVVRQGYVSILERTENLRVAGEAENGNVALEKFSQNLPDIVVVDIIMQGMNGIELIKELGAREYDVPALVISMYDETVYAERALKAGAMGYIMKNEVDVVIVEAINTVLDGGIYVSEQMNARILMHSVGRSTDGGPTFGNLSDRELEVFQYIGRGLTTGEIAEQMFISPKTVGTHRRRIQEKLDIPTTAKLRQRAAVWTHLGETV